MSGIHVSRFLLGSLVTVKTAFLSEPAGVIAYVYEVYDKPGLSGISLITQNGIDLGGFSILEQDRFLEYYGDTGNVYKFRNCAQLYMDWQNGVFKSIFDNVERYKKELT